MNDPLIEEWKRDQKFGVVRSGRTLLPVSAEDFRPAPPPAVTARPPAPTIFQHVGSLFRRAYLVHLRWQLERLREVRASIPYERIALRQAEERRHERRLVDIGNEAERRMLESKHRLDELDAEIKALEGGAA